VFINKWEINSLATTIRAFSAHAHPALYFPPAPPSTHRSSFSITHSKKLNVKFSTGIQRRRRQQQIVFFRERIEKSGKNLFTSVNACECNNGEKWKQHKYSSKAHLTVKRRRKVFPIYVSFLWIKKDSRVDLRGWVTCGDCDMGQIFCLCNFFHFFGLWSGVFGGFMFSIQTQAQNDLGSMTS